MKLKVNGELKEIEVKNVPTTLTKVIKQLGHDQQLVVVEFNGKIQPTYTWDQEYVKDGDTLEIVTIVGGGS